MTWHLDFFVDCFPSLSMYAWAFDFFFSGLKPCPFKTEWPVWFRPDGRDWL